MKPLSQHFEKGIYQYVNISLQERTPFKEDCLVAASCRKTPVLESLLILSIAKCLRTPILKNICVRLLLKMCSWNGEKLKFIRSFNFTLENRFFRHQHQKQVKIFVFTSWMVFHEVCIYIQYFFGVVRNKL